MEDTSVATLRGSGGLSSLSSELHGMGGRGTTCRHLACRHQQEAGAFHVELPAWGSQIASDLLLKGFPWSTVSVTLSSSVTPAVLSLLNEHLSGAQGAGW